MAGPEVEDHSQPVLPGVLELSNAFRELTALSKVSD